MKVEYWNAAREEWRVSDYPWTAEQVSELNGALGWERYREAE